MAEFAWDPNSYLALMAEEVPDYRRLQDELVSAATEQNALRVLDLGIGSGLTARRVADAMPAARLVGVDDSAEMLEAAQQILEPSRASLVRGRLQDPLPTERFDLVISMLAVHHLDADGKADLFARIAEVLDRRAGRLVLADLITPVDPDDVVTPIDGVIDTPSPLADQLEWMRAAGLRPEVRWKHRDLVVIVAYQEGKIRRATP